MPQGPDWPSALLRRLSKPLEGSRPAVLGEPLARAADELLRFRHVAMHSYDHFDAAAETFLRHVEGDIAAFRATIDPV